MGLNYSNGHALADDGSIGVTMLIAPQEDIDQHGHIYRYFEYVTSFMQPATRVEWDIDSMFAVLPADTALFLIKKGYARGMREDEIEAYNKADKIETEPPAEPPKEPPAETPAEPPIEVAAEPEKVETIGTETNQPKSKPAEPAPKSKKKGERQ